MIRYSGFALHSMPSLTVVDKIQVDRIQSIDPTSTLNREKNKEVGRDGVIDYSKKTPSIAYRAVQNESQDLKFFESLANVASGTDMTHASFNASAADLIAHLTDDDEVVLGSVWYPKLRLAGFSINSADPDAKIERNFDLVGEAAHVFQGANKYLVAKRELADTGEVAGGDWTYTANDPVPVEDPANAGVFFMRVTRIRAGVTTDLVAGAGTNQHEFSAPTLTVHDAVVGDYYKLFYTAVALPAAESKWTDEDTAPGATLAYNVTVLLGSTELTKIQSVGIDVRFEREDWKEQGNKEIVQRGVNDRTVTITLPRLLEDYTLDELLLGESAGFGHIDIENYLDNLTFRFKVFTDDGKGTMAWGMKITNCTPTEVKTPIAVDGYTNRDLTLASESFVISTTEGTIDA